MIGHAEEITAIENLGYEVVYVGETRPKCKHCGKYALKTRSILGIYLCEIEREGCGITSSLSEAGPRIKLWRVGKSINGVDTLIYVSEEVLKRLPKLTKKQFDDWYFGWDDSAIIDTLAKAELPDELSKIENSVLLKPESSKVERIGKMRI